MARACSHRNLLAVASLFVALAVHGQSPMDRTFYKDALRADLEVIRQTLEQAHPDPYRYQGKNEVAKLFDGISAGLDPGLTAEEFMEVTLPVFRAIGDAGTFLSPPVAVEQAYEHVIPLIPFKVAVIDNRLYLNDELKGFRSLPPGCEIISINGNEAGRIIERLRGSMVPEGANTTLLDRRIEQDFPVLYRRWLDQSDRFEVVYALPDGTLNKQEVIALTKEEMRRTYRRKGFDLKPWRYQELPALRTGWLTLATFEPKDLDDAKVNIERFLADVQRALRKGDVLNLVIDVRGAAGSDVGLAEQVFALVAQERYRVLSGMSIRSGEVPDSYRYAKPNPEFFASVGGMYLPEFNGRRELNPNDQRLLMINPSAKAFEGKVYVLANGVTTGAAAAFVMLAKRTGRARIVGEEVGTNAMSFCGGRTLEVTLPRTGCILHVPLTCFVPDGAGAGPIDRGELPTYEVRERASDLAEGKDTLRESLLMLIAEMQ